MKEVVGFLLLIFTLILIGYGSYKLKRWINWSFGGYGTEAASVVREMVKPECLRGD